MIRPIRNYILVEPLSTESVSAGGIIVPDSFKERGAKAKVLAVGGGTRDEPMRIPNGVICWHMKDAGDEIIENGVKYYLIQSRDVLGYLPN